MYNVYKITAECHYNGSSLVAALSADEANEIIKEFKENIWSTRTGIIDYGIYYYG